MTNTEPLNYFVCVNQSCAEYNVYKTNMAIGVSNVLCGKCGRRCEPRPATSVPPETPS